MKLGRRDKSDTITIERGPAPSSTANEGFAEMNFEVPEVALAEPRRPAAGTEPFGALLVRRGLVSEEDVAQALVVQEDSGKRLGETLVDMGALNERKLTLVLADLLHMPVVDLRRDNPNPTHSL